MGGSNAAFPGWVDSVAEWQICYLDAQTGMTANKAPIVPPKHTEFLLRTQETVQDIKLMQSTQKVRLTCSHLTLMSVIIHAI